jgi:hypothetical protein
MKKYALLALSLAATVGLVGLSSCSKDDPIPRQTVSFERSAQTFTEAAGVVEVNVILDQAAGEDIKVQFDVDGTALEGAASTTGTDYEITSGSGEVTIKKGQTKGVIELKIKNDVVYEGDETITFEITGTSSTNVDISADNTINITLSEDDPQSIISFTTSTYTVNEDDGIVEIEVTIDHPAQQDITVTYQAENQDQWQTTNVALSYDYASTIDNLPPFYIDYFAVDADDNEIDLGQVVIPQGETTAKIRLVLYSDFSFDDGETIDLTLTGANGGTTITTTTSKKKAKVTIGQGDGKSIELYWGGLVSANLDLYLWGAQNPADLSAIGDQTSYYCFSNYAQQSTDPANYASEFMFVPALWSQLSAVDAFAVSVVYRAGNVDPVNFSLEYWDWIDGAFEADTDIDQFDGVYHAANKNNFPTSGVYPAVAQTFDLVAGKLQNYSVLNVPASGSRVKSNNFSGTRTIMLPNGIRKTYTSSGALVSTKMPTNAAMLKYVRSKK